MEIEVVAADPQEQQDKKKKKSETGGDDPVVKKKKHVVFKGNDPDQAKADDLLSPAMIDALIKVVAADKKEEERIDNLVELTEADKEKKEKERDEESMRKQLSKSWLHIERKRKDHVVPLNTHAKNEYVSKYVASMKETEGYFDQIYKKDYKYDKADGGTFTFKIDDTGKIKELSTARVITKIFREWKKSGAEFDIPRSYIKFCVLQEFKRIEAPKPSKLEDAIKFAPETETEVFIPRYDPGEVEKPRAELVKVAKKKDDFKAAQSAKPIAYWTVDPETGKSFSDKGLKFLQGQWVEYRGNDMRWHLAPIRRIVKTADDDGDDDEDGDDVEPDWKYYYNIGNQTLVHPLNVRCSEEGLKRLFGLRPFVWQQWALLQIESSCRFQSSHEMDYESIGFRAEAAALWDYWYNHEKNREFRCYCEAYDALFPRSYDKLVEHIFSPFKLMDEIAKDKEEWDFESKVSLFTYASVFGSGFFTILITLFIQFMVPILLLLVQMAQSGGGQYGLGPDCTQVVCRFNPGFFQTDWSTFCSGLGNPYGRAMQVVVIAVYVVKVLPEMFFNFYNTAGGTEKASTKLKMLREIIWEQGDDTIWMMIGYKLDEYMNTLYIGLILTLLLFILFLTNDVFSIILNALALEFVYILDDDLAESEFYDPDERWIRAGAIEMVFRSSLRLSYFHGWKEFCLEYDIDIAQWQKIKILENSNLHHYHQGRYDLQDKALMKKSKRYYKDAAEISKELNNKNARENFDETTKAFGMWDRILVKFNFLDYGVFSRYKSYCVWSKWRHVIFLANTPKASDRDIIPREADGVVKPNLSKKPGPNESYLTDEEAKKQKGKLGTPNRGVWMTVEDRLGGPYVKTKIIEVQKTKKVGDFHKVRVIDIVVTRKHRTELDCTFFFPRPDSDKFYLGFCSNKMLASNNEKIVKRIFDGIKKKEAEEDKRNKEDQSSVSQTLTHISDGVQLLGGFLAESLKLLEGRYSHEHYLNFTDESDKSDLMLFFDIVKETLLFQRLLASVGGAVRRGRYGEILFRIVDGFIEWFAFLYQIIFPIILLLFLIAAIVCY